MNCRGRRRKLSIYVPRTCLEGLMKTSMILIYTGWPVTKNWTRNISNVK